MSGRRAADELDPELRDRLLSLDEPVSRPDWQDVMSRSGTERTRRTAARATVAALAVCAAAIAVAPAMGINLGVINFWSAPRAPASAEQAFTQVAKVMSQSELRGLNFAQIRRIAVEVFKGDTERLFVAPRAGGGFCYEWATQPGDPGVWATELGGCADLSRPINLSYDDTRVSILATRARVDHIVVGLTNGQTVTLTPRWVSAPVDAGFLLYQPPNKTHVLWVEAVGKLGNVVETDQLDQQIFHQGLR